MNSSGFSQTELLEWSAWKLIYTRTPFGILYGPMMQSCSVILHSVGKVSYIDKLLQRKFQMLILKVVSHIYNCCNLSSQSGSKLNFPHAFYISSICTNTSIQCRELKSPWDASYNWIESHCFLYGIAQFWHAFKVVKIQDSWRLPCWCCQQLKFVKLKKYRSLSLWICKDTHDCECQSMCSRFKAPHNHCAYLSLQLVI